MAIKRKNLPEVVPELFEHEQFGQFRFIKRGEELCFAAVDLCRVLGLTNPTMSLENFDDDEKMTLSITEGQKMTVSTTYGHSGKRGGAQFMTFVSEPGLYRLIFVSRKPEAEKFKRWVFHEVLPSIRKYGFYGLLNSEQMLQLPIQQYVNYLGKLTPEQYGAHLGGLTADQYYEHYERLKKNLPNMTQEEILSLVNDPHVVVSKIIGGKWKANFF